MGDELADVVSRLKRESADYAMAYDLIARLTRIMNEAEAVEGIMGLFTALFAPGKLVYVPFEAGKIGSARSRPVPLSEEDDDSSRHTALRLMDRAEDYAWSESGRGFALRIGHLGETLGVLQIDDIAFPEYKEHYLNLSLTLAGVCGLAIANARSFEKARAMEDALAAERMRLDVTLRSIGDGVVATDTEGRVSLFNRAAEVLTGWTMEDAAGRRLSEVFHIIDEKTRATRENPVEKTLSTGRVVELANDTVLIARDGTERAIGDSSAPIRDEEGNILGVVLVFRDITVGKEAAEQVRKLSRAIEQSPSSVVITDAQGNIEYVNPKFTQISGYGLEEVIGQNPRVLKSGDKQPEEYRVMWETIASGKEWRGEFHNKKKNGDLYWESASISPIRNPEGTITHFVAVKEDITEQKRAEEERNRLLQELEKRAAELDASNKELEAFSYSVSHDLRAPLRSIDGFSLALLEDCADALDDVGKGYLQSVRRASQRMGEIIDDMLRLARIARREMRPERVDLGALAQDVAAELRRTAPERAVEFKIAPGLEVTADARLMRIVLENLLGNAWKFTSGHATGRIEFGATDWNGTGVYFVRDDGAGFDMEYADKLFGAFQRLHYEHEFPGNGIGLATVQRIIRRHGGQIWAEGKVEGGATFYFAL